MDLELRNVQVKDVVLGDKNDLKDGVPSRANPAVSFR